MWNMLHGYLHLTIVQPRSKQCSGITETVRVTMATRQRDQISPHQPESSHVCGQSFPLRGAKRLVQPNAIPVLNKV